MSGDTYETGITQTVSSGMRCFELREEVGEVSKVVCVELT